VVVAIIVYGEWGGPLRNTDYRRYVNVGNHGGMDKILNQAVISGNMEYKYFAKQVYAHSDHS